MSDDIVHKAVTPSFVIVGLFTPDYRPMAEGLAASILRHADMSRTSYHLYAVPKPEGTDWHDIILLKPKIILEAMAQYPATPVVFMDVDCRINGDISQLADLAVGDVAIPYIAKVHPSKHGLFWSSSRVVVVRPNDAAKLLMVNWLHLCESTTVKNDETMLSMAMSITPKASIEVLPFKFSAMEENQLHGRSPAISHISAHSASRPGHARKVRFRSFRRKLISRIVGRPYPDWKNSLQPR